MISDEPFVVIYSHMTPVPLLSQKVLLAKYYSILPDNYKKNLKRLFIVHHQLNLDVSQFLLLTKTYVQQPQPQPRSQITNHTTSSSSTTTTTNNNNAQKTTLYNKIVLVSSLAHLQSLIAPVFIPFSYRLARYCTFDIH